MGINCYSRRTTHFKSSLLPDSTSLIAFNSHDRYIYSFLRRIVPGPKHPRANKLLTHLLSTMASSGFCPYRNGDGDGRLGDGSTVMDSGAQQDNSTAMDGALATQIDDEEGTRATAMSTRPTMEATKASAPSRH